MVKCAINLMVCQIFLLTIPINGGIHMAQKNIASIKATINPDRRPLIYYTIDNDDCESVSFYENNGCAVRTITLNGKPHRFALVPAKTQKQADRFNRELNFLRQQEQHSLQQKIDNETSYDPMIEDRYAFTVDHSDPADILVNLSVTKALSHKLDNLSEQQRCICQMIGAGMSAREMAAELDIPRITLHRRKLKLLKELKILLKEYR